MIQSTPTPACMYTQRTTRRPGWIVAGALVATSLAAGMGVLASNDRTAEAGIVPTVPLGTAAAFSVLGAEEVTNTGPSILHQSLGVSPGSAISGFPPGLVLAPATTHGPDGVTLQAQIDNTTAYTNAANRSVEFTESNPDLGGRTLLPGVYEATSQGPLGLTGELVLDGGGNTDAVFIFQTDSTLTTSTGSSIRLINGASECNVFWQVGSSATLRTGSTFVGTILALTSITVQGAVTVHGRALAQTGAVTLDNDTFLQPSCVPTEITPTTTTTSPGGDTSTTTASGGTTPGGGTTPSGGTTVGGTFVAPGNTTFDVTDITLPSTGSSTTKTTSMVAVIALLLGPAALFLARRRTTS